MELTILPSSKVSFLGQYLSGDATLKQSITYTEVKLKDLANLDGAVCMFLHFIQFIVQFIVVSFN